MSHGPGGRELELHILAMLPKETSLKTWLCLDAFEDPTESLLVLHWWSNTQLHVAFPVWGADLDTTAHYRQQSSCWSQKTGQYNFSRLLELPWQEHSPCCVWESSAPLGWTPRSPPWTAGALGSAATSNRSCCELQELWTWVSPGFFTPQD